MKDKKPREVDKGNSKEKFVEVESPDDFSYEGNEARRSAGKTKKPR